MNHRDHSLTLLGKTLSELSPLIAAAMQVLNQPGSRTLRRKIDSEFHFAAGIYGALRCTALPECEWDTIALPRYERATVIWPAGEARKAKALAVDVPSIAAPVVTPAGSGLRLVVDNGRAPRVVATADGGAA